MLQIISGKFFTSNDRHVHAGKGIFYSNYAWIAPIETCVGTLEPVDVYHAVSSYVLNYTNQIEKVSNIIRVGDSEVVEQFQQLAMFGLRAYFSPLRMEVEHLCRQSSTERTDACPPAQFVPRFFATGIRGTYQEVEHFRHFVEKVIGLKRAKYVSVMNVLHTVHDALQVIEYNLDLAYSMLVYALESLAQEYDGYAPQWTDYDQDVRARLDPLLAHVADDVATAMRDVLIGAKQLRLQKRFTSFVISHIGDSFFVEEARGVVNALRRSELERALRNAYRMRSQYVHVLRKIPDQLRVPGIAMGDVFHWDREPYLTLSGLVRVTLHVIADVVWRADSVVSEAFAWRHALPGTILFRAAPQYWIWQTEAFEPQHATDRLSGLLVHLNDLYAKKGPITNLVPLLARIEEIFASSPPRHKTAMLAIYWLYNANVAPDGRRPEWEKFVTDNVRIIDTCCIEMLIARLIITGSLPWRVTECLGAYSTYEKERYQKSGLELPVIMEIAVLCELANAALKEGSLTLRSELLAKAIMEAGGQARLQEQLIAVRQSEKAEVDVQRILHPEGESVPDGDKAATS